MDTQPDGGKLCECGCGRPAPISKTTRRKLGHFKGQPVRFIRGHYGREWDVEARFWSKVDKNGPIPEFAPELGRCWIWTAALTGGRFDYGVFATTDADGTKRRHRAHRWIMEQRHGPIAEGLEIDHRCRVPQCVRPEHLEVVTPKVNARRSPLRSRHVFEKDYPA